MADSVEESESDNATELEDGVCRDYMRGRCDRKLCKYKHEALPKNMKLNFCHDFQNSFCPRPKCKFIHCSPDEEDDFKKSGVMSNRILVEATKKNQIPGIQPVCNEFRKGTCRRNNCKYRHVTYEEEDAEILEFIQWYNKKPHFTLSEPKIIYASSTVDIDSDDFQTIDFDDYGPKNRLMRNDDLNIPESEKYYYDLSTSPTPSTSRDMMEEEISRLKYEVVKLKRQLQTATAKNSFLSRENEALRSASKRRRVASSSSLTDPTSVSRQQLMRRVTAGVTSIPVSIATVPVSLTTVPVSLTTVTTCNRVTIAAVPSVSIAPTAQLLAQSPQILVTPSTQLEIANNSEAQLTIAASTAQQLTVANVPHQFTLTSQGPQELSLTSPNQQQLTLTNQLALVNQNQQQLTLANQNQTQQLSLTNQNQTQLSLTSRGQHFPIAHHLEFYDPNTIETSQPIDLSHATKTLVSLPMVVNRHRKHQM